MCRDKKQTGTNNFDELQIKVNVDASEVVKELDDIINRLACITKKLSITCICNK